MKCYPSNQKLVNINSKVENITNQNNLFGLIFKYLSQDNKNI